MNKQELNRALSHIHASDCLKEEVLMMKSKSKIDFRLMAKRAAVCAAALALLVSTVFFWPGENKEDGQIIAVTGVLQAYACELENEDVAYREEYALIEGGDFSKISAWSPIMDFACRGISLSFLVDEVELQDYVITFDISTNCGELCGSRMNGYPDLGKNTTIYNGGTVYWTGFEVWNEYISQSETLEETVNRFDGIFIDVIIKADENIIGYAIIEIGCPYPDVFILYSALKTSVYFPKVNGEFQQITEAYLAQQIVTAKDS